MKYRLLSPGPTPVPERVLLAMGGPMLHHRTPAFEAVFKRCRAGLAKVFGTTGDVLTLASSGTGAFEAGMVSTLSPGDKVVAVHNGKFGERWAKMARAVGMQVTEVKTPWGRTTAVEDVAAALKATPDARALLAVWSESSTGARQPIEAFADLTGGTDTLLMVDAITACGVWPMNMDSLGVDVLVTGSQKALMLPPGLGFVALSPKAWAAAEKAKAARFYFDLRRERDAQQKNQSAFTPAVGLVLGLAEALNMLDEEGLDNVYARHARMARATRAAVTAMGFSLFAQTPADSITSITSTPHLDADKLYKHLRDRWNMTIAGGQDHLKPSVFRVAHLGHYDDLDILTVISAVETACHQLGYKLPLGAGVAAAQQVLLAAG